MSKAPQFESAIVGALIECNGSDLPANLAHLQENAPESFDDLRCGQVAAAIRTLGNQGRAVHAAAIVELVKFEGASVFVSELVANALPLELAELEAAEVFERYRTRRMATLFDEGAKALLANPNDANSISGHVRAELEHIEHGAHGQALTFRSPDELLAMEFDDGDRILGDRLLSRGGSLVIAGPGSIGKSRLLLQLGVACRAGLPFVGFETRAQDLTWLILQAENSNRRLQSDFAALREWVWQLARWGLVSTRVRSQQRHGWLAPKRRLAGRCL